MTERRSESAVRPSPLVLRALSGAAVLTACSEPAPRPRPVEVPISEYKVGGIALPEPTSRATTSSSPLDRDRDSGSVASVAEEPRTVGDPSTLSRELDVKGGFLGATLGATPKAFRGLILLDKKPDLATYRAPDKSYGGFPLRDVLFIFRKGKLATIQFAVRNPADCRPVRETLTRELGTPQRASGESATWRGEKVALRFVTGTTGACSGAVQSKELARAEWDLI